jgi:hypothetical protein
MFSGDFYILDVKYDPDTELAKELKISEPYGLRPGPSFWVGRDQVIGAIEDGFMVELLPPLFRMILKRLFLKVVEVNGKKYLRADGASVARDWVGLG